MHLQISNLSKTYPNGVTALKDVSLSIPPGMFGLLGPNGAGKSTLMRILATLQEADWGSATLGDLDVLRDKEAVRRTLGYLPQEFGLYPRASAEEMLDHFALLKGVEKRSERRELVKALLSQTNLWNARRQKLGGFSGGMRQRFGIAVALIGQPRLIIVDEPTAGLDPAERARFLNLLSELGENAVVILSTHIVEDVSDLCTRMAVIENGVIRLEAEPATAVDALRGRMWRRQVDRAELPRFEQAHPVISTTLVGGRTVIHVYGDARPDPSFEPVEPDLKDVYFTVMRGIAVGPRPAQTASVDGDLSPRLATAASGDAGDAAHAGTASSGDAAPSIAAGDAIRAVLQWTPRGAAADAAPASAGAWGAEARSASAEGAREASGGAERDASPGSTGIASPDSASPESTGPFRFSSPEDEAGEPPPLPERWGGEERP